MATAALVVVGTPLTAQAAPVEGFQPGNIISDGNFYDSGAMSPDQIQAFLNERVGRCTIGDPGRAPGTPIYGTVVAQKCLANSTHLSVSKPANAYCKAFIGRDHESAASVIARVAQACSISPRVLLIMLEKEQSLVTDNWPTARQFSVAMGYACPDSGPNNSANCNSNYFGFTNQVYYGAWQLQVYKGNPGSFNYRPFRTNTIQWHPNSGCGTSQVYIENWATASLYIYTPYRPNQAALDAGWGTGDACSSYGNRNFYNFYKTWFGAPSLSVDPNLAAFYNGNRAFAGELRAPAQGILDGVMQETTNGTMFWSPATGAAFLNGAIRSSYAARGAMGGPLGFPVWIERDENGARAQDFNRGTIYWRPATGALAVSNGIRTHVAASGGTAALGLPTTEELLIPSGGAYQEFDRSIVTWGGEGVGAVTIWGGILSSYRQGGGAAAFGSAWSPEKGVAGGAWQSFRQQDIHWTGARGGIPVFGGIRSTVNRVGGPEVTGLATGREAGKPDGTVLQDFGQRSVIWSSATGGLVVTPAIRDFYYANGAAANWSLVGDTGTEAQAEVQRITRGVLINSSGNGVQPVIGGVYNAFVRFGGIAQLGYPLGPERPQPDGSVIQEFSKASIVWSATGGASLLQGKFLALYAEMGSVPYGFPKGAEESLPDGSLLRFERGSAYGPTDGEAFVVSGRMLQEYQKAGGPERLGYPTAAAETQSDGTVSQSFQRSRIVIAPSGAVTVTPVA